MPSIQYFDRNNATAIQEEQSQVPGQNASKYIRVTSIQLAYSAWLMAMFSNSRRGECVCVFVCFCFLAYHLSQRW